MIDRVFKSKVDAWLVGVLSVMVLALVVIGLAMLIVPPIKVGYPKGMVLYPAGIILLLAAALMASTLAWTSYTLTDALLLVRSGPLRWRIPFGMITDVTPIRSPFSGPALSMDRLMISYGGWRSILISPVDQQDFLAELKARRGALRDA